MTGKNTKQPERNVIEDEGGDRSGKKDIRCGVLTAMAAICFAAVFMLYFAPRLAYCADTKNMILMAVCLSLFLVPVGLYFGLRRRVELMVLLFVLLISGAALAVRIPLFDHMSSDYNTF